LWRDLIEEVVAVKVQEAVRRKARKEAQTVTSQQQQTMEADQ
jgi:ecotropic viral integration site 5 protein